MQKLTAEQIAVRNAFIIGDKPKTVLVEHKGVELEVRQPSLGVRNEVYKAAKITADAEEGEEGSAGKVAKSGKVRIDFDFGKMQIGAVIVCTYFPGTDVRVFNETDHDTLSGALAGGGIDKLVEAAMKMLNVKQADVEKK